LDKALNGASEACTLEHFVTLEIVDPPKNYQVDTNADLEVYVCCPDGCDLVGGTVAVIDAEGSTLAEQRLVAYLEDWKVNTTESFSVPMPKEPGEYTWNILFSPFEAAHDSAAGQPEPAAKPSAGLEGEALDLTELAGTDDTGLEGDGEPLSSHAVVQAEFSFSVVAHVTGMAVWVAHPVFAGGTFELDIGINCIHGCSLAGQKVTIHHNGELLTSVEMKEPQAPMLGLYHATATLSAPLEAGRDTLECRFEPEGIELAHAPSTRSFSYAIVPKPQTRLEITISETEKGTPVEEAHLAIYSAGGYVYRAQTDAQGNAAIELPYGEYRIRAICGYYHDVEETLTLSEGQELCKVSLKMLFDSDLGSLPWLR